MIDTGKYIDKRGDSERRLTRDAESLLNFLRLTDGPVTAGRLHLYLGLSTRSIADLKIEINTDSVENDRPYFIVSKFGYRYISMDNPDKKFITELLEQDIRTLKSRAISMLSQLKLYKKKLQYWTDSQTEMEL